MALSKGGFGLLDAHLERLRNQCLVHREGHTMEMQVVLWCYNNAQYVPLVKWRTQVGTTAKVSRSQLVLEVES